MKDHFKKYWWAYALVLVLLIVLAVYYYNKYKSGTSSETMDVVTGLKYGDRGREVIRLQELINQGIDIINTQQSEFDRPRIAVDGIFGPETRDGLEFVTGRTSISLQDMERFLQRENMPTFDGWQELPEQPATRAAI